MALKLAVYGLGAIGGVLAARLATAGHEVTGICRGATLAAVRGQGLRVTDGTGTRRIDLATTDDPASAGPQDMVFACVKANALPDVVDGLRVLCGAGTVLVPMVNGVPFWFFDGFGGSLQGCALDSVDPGGALAAAFPAAGVAGAVVHVSASVPEPGHIHHHAGERLIVGPPVPEAAAGAARVAELLAGAGFTVEHEPAIREAVWAKLAGNLNFNPISALTGATVDRIARDAETKALCVATMREVLQVSGELGLSLRLDPEERMALALKLGPFRTSMLQDADAGRRLELDPIVGAVVEIADRLQIPVPYTRTLYGLARLLDGSLAAA
ncbi:MAG: 2-dehydropantoate 2-reductase [Phycisphaerales bacterium]